MRTFIKEHKFEICIFFLAAFLRLIFFLICLRSNIANGGDLVGVIHGQDWYFEISHNLLAGNGFSKEIVAPFAPYSYGVPAYPYFLFFLLLLTGSYAAVSVAQIFLSATIPVLGMRLARIILPEDTQFKNIPITVGIMLALAPLQIVYSYSFFTETLFTVVFTAFLIAFLNFLREPSLKFSLLSGLLLGLSALTKQTVQYVPLLVLVFILWRFRGRLRKRLFVNVSCFLFAFCAVVSPWVWRNYTTFHTASLGSAVSFNVFYTLLPSVRVMENHSTFKEEQQKLVAVPNDPSFEKSAKMAEDEILHRPVGLIKLCVLSAFTFFTHDGMLTFIQTAGIEGNAHIQRPATLLLLSSPVSFVKTVWGYLHTVLAVVFFARVFWVVLATFFFFGLYRLFSRHFLTPQILFAVIMVFYFMLTTMINGLSVNARFRIPVEPVIFVVACTGLFPFCRKIKDIIHERSA